MSWGWIAGGAALLGGVSSFMQGRAASKANALQAQSRSEWAQWNFDQDTRRTLLQADTAATRADVDRRKATLERTRADIALAAGGITRDQAELIGDQVDYAGVRAAEAIRVGQLGARLKQLDTERLRSVTASTYAGIMRASEANDAAFEASRSQLAQKWAERNRDYDDQIAEATVGAASVGVAGMSVAQVTRRIERRQARDEKLFALEDAALEARGLAERTRLQGQASSLLLNSAYQERYNSLMGEDAVQRATVQAEGIGIEAEGLRIRGASALLDARKFDLAHGAHTLSADALVAGAVLGERSAVEAIEGLNSRPAVLDYAGLARMADSGWGDVGSFLSGAASGASLLMTGRELWSEFVG